MLILNNLVRDRMKKVMIRIPWWLPHAYLDARMEGFEGSMSDFVNYLIL